MPTPAGMFWAFMMDRPNEVGESDWRYHWELTTMSPTELVAWLREMADYIESEDVEDG